MTDNLHPVPLSDRIALREDEAAELLGMSASTLHRLAIAGVVPRIPLLPDMTTALYSRLALERWALDRSDYADPKEIGNGYQAQAVNLRGGQRLPAERRTVGRGRSRAGSGSQAPVRLLGRVGEGTSE
jgi:hypothetical protein